MAVNSNPPVQLDPSQDQGHQIAFINQNFQSLANSLNPFILSDGTNNRLLIGKDSVGNYVVKVSKAGYDAFNAADANLIFNSGQDVFKVVGKYTTAFSHTSGATASSATTSITHNLGYVPLAFCTVNITTNQINAGETGVLSLPYILFGTGGGTTNVFVALAFVKLFRVDSTTLTFQVGAQGNSLTLAGTITAYILQETAT